MVEWIKSEHTGLRYREHESKTTGVGRGKRPLRYYMMTYKLDGKTVSESLGWEGEYIKNEDHARRINQKLRDNRKDRTPPFTLAEYRQQNEETLQAAREEAAVEAILNLTFTEVFEKYLVASKLKKRNPRSWKREDQLARLHIFPVVGSLPLMNVAQVPHIQKIQNSMAKAGLSPRTIRYALHVIRIVFNFASDEGLYSGPNPAQEKKKTSISSRAAGIEYPQQDNKKDRYLSREEAGLLLGELAKRSDEVHNMAYLSLYTGMRFGEVANLKWGDVDLFQGVIMLRNTKSGKDRPAYMNPGVKKLMSSIGPGEPDHLVFPARGTDNKPHYMISSVYYKVVKELFNQGVTDKKQWVNFHTLRHTFASWLVEKDTNLYLVKDLLGHSDLKITERYAHIGDNQRRQAVLKLQNG
ncbi:MAG: tyrosine-type recombinase/integrase [Desulfoprunum sp.]